MFFFVLLAPHPRGLRPMRVTLDVRLSIPFPMSSMLPEYTSSSSQYSSRQGVDHWHYGEKQRLFTTKASHALFLVTYHSSHTFEL